MSEKTPLIPKIPPSAEVILPLPGGWERVRTQAHTWREGGDLIVLLTFLPSYVKRYAWTFILIAVPIISFFVPTKPAVALYFFVLVLLSFMFQRFCIKRTYVQLRVTQDEVRVCTSPYLFFLLLRKHKMRRRRSGLVVEKIFRRSDIEGIGWTSPKHPFFQFIGARQPAFYGDFDPRVVVPAMKLLGDEIGVPTEIPRFPFLLRYKRK